MGNLNVRYQKIVLMFVVDGILGLNFEPDLLSCFNDVNVQRSSVYQLVLSDTSTKILLEKITAVKMLSTIYDNVI